MLIAISATESSVRANVDGRFGRCKHFMIFDTETSIFTPLENKAQFASGGAGIQAAQAIQNSGATVVLTGNVGPNAFTTLTAADIEIYVGASGTLQEAIRNFQAGTYKKAMGATVESKHGPA